LLSRPNPSSPMTARTAITTAKDFELTR
jgi:hypothetical protein